MPQILQQPQNADEVARLAGRDIYETPVGMLRRAELWRLGNAWGFKFPNGASKDFMLPFFKQLEAEGKNPLRPPGANLDTLVKARAVEHSEVNHAETAEEEELPSITTAVREAIIKPEPKSDFALKLEKMPMGDLKKLCRLRGIEQSNRDRKHDLVSRILDASKGHDKDVENPPPGRE